MSYSHQFQSPVVAESTVEPMWLPRCEWCGLLAAGGGWPLRLRHRVIACSGCLGDWDRAISLQREAASWADCARLARDHGNTSAAILAQWQAASLHRAIARLMCHDIWRGRSERQAERLRLGA